MASKSKSKSNSNTDFPSTMNTVNTARDAASGHTFPVKLHMLLETIDPESPHADIISWLPGGKAFKVLQKEEFVRVFLPAFSNASKFKSFQRNLNLWNFHTVSKGPKKGVCSHAHFIQGKPDHVRLMKRVSVKGTRVRRPPSPSIASFSSTEQHQHQPPVKEILKSKLRPASSLEGPLSSLAAVAVSALDSSNRSYASTGCSSLSVATHTRAFPETSVSSRLSQLVASATASLPQGAETTVLSSSSESTNPFSNLVSEEAAWRAAVSQASQEILAARLMNATSSSAPEAVAPPRPATTASLLASLFPQHQHTYQHQQYHHQPSLLESFAASQQQQQQQQQAAFQELLLVKALREAGVGAIAPPAPPNSNSPTTNHLLSLIAARGGL